MRLWTTRLLVAVVTAWNVQAAIAFIASPGSFVYAYELSGAVGEAAIRGLGILFLMWNVPYGFAAVHPVRYRLGLVCALLMQSIGLIGESYIYFTLPTGHEILQSSVLRFILFDGTGLVLLFFAWLATQKHATAQF
ncbi:MAG: hypothetical protein HYZ23_05770 [Chloroflexi bacterium]|nr:hypothetical protein [Chloroflexota bacterium]